jgi:hypothetical protein
MRPFSDDYILWWETARTNWSSVCAACLGCAAIYNIKDPKRLVVILRRVINSLECYLQGFDDDGITTEGLSYWQYGFSYFVFFTELLKERTAGKVNLFKGELGEKIQKIVRYPTYLQLSDGKIVNFSDAVENFKPRVGLLMKLEQTFGEMSYDYSQCANYNDDHTEKWVYFFRDILWGDLKVQNYKKSAGNSTHFFSKPQWLIDKRETKQGAIIAFAAKGGHNGESHNHNDLGHFIVHMCGVNLFSDLGPPEYTQQYFDNEQRYNSFNASSKGHSVPVINGKLQISGDNAFASIINFKSDEENTSLSLDLTHAYGIEYLNKFVRTFVWVSDKNNSADLFLSDKFEFTSGENVVEEVFITTHQPSFTDDGRILIKKDVATASLEFDSEHWQGRIEKEEFVNQLGDVKIFYRIILSLSSTEKFVELKLKAKIYSSVIAK